MVALWQRKKMKNRIIEKPTACVDKRLWTASWGWSHKVLREYSSHRWEVAVHKKVLLRRLGLECSHKCTLSDQRALRSGLMLQCSEHFSCCRPQSCKTSQIWQCICKSELGGIWILGFWQISDIWIKWLLLQKALQLACCLVRLHVA